MPKKLILIFIKYFLEKKSSLSHPISEKKSDEGIIHPPPSSNHPSHTTKEIIP
jgi:hypothetical protein